MSARLRRAVARADLAEVRRSMEEVPSVPVLRDSYLVALKAGRAAALAEIMRKFPSIGEDFMADGGAWDALDHAIKNDPALFRVLKERFGLSIPADHAMSIACECISRIDAAVADEVIGVVATLGEHSIRRAAARMIDAAKRDSMMIRAPALDALIAKGGEVAYNVLLDTIVTCFASWDVDFAFAEKMLVYAGSRAGDAEMRAKYVNVARDICQRALNDDNLTVYSICARAGLGNLSRACRFGAAKCVAWELANIKQKPTWAPKGPDGTWAYGLSHERSSDPWVNKRWNGSSVANTGMLIMKCGFDLQDAGADILASSPDFLLGLDQSLFQYLDIPTLPSAEYVWTLTSFATESHFLDSCDYRAGALPALPLTAKFVEHLVRVAIKYAMNQYQYNFVNDLRSAFASGRLVVPRTDAKTVQDIARVSGDIAREDLCSRFCNLSRIQSNLVECIDAVCDVLYAMCPPEDFPPARWDCAAAKYEDEDGRVNVHCTFMSRGPFYGDVIRMKFCACDVRGDSPCRKCGCAVVPEPNPPYPNPLRPAASRPAASSPGAFEKLSKFLFGAPSRGAKSLGAPPAAALPDLDTADVLKMTRVVALGDCTAMRTLKNPGRAALAARGWAPLVAAHAAWSVAGVKYMMKIAAPGDPLELRAAIKAAIASGCMVEAVLEYATAGDLIDAGVPGGPEFDAAVKRGAPAVAAYLRKFVDLAEARRILDECLAGRDPFPQPGPEACRPLPLAEMGVTCVYCLDDLPDGPLDVSCSRCLRCTRCSARVHAECHAHALQHGHVDKCPVCAAALVSRA